MFARIALILVTVFWVTMNVLLWRVEYGRRHHAGSSVPPALVWQKMLTAPDNSYLDILHHGEKIGSCQWSTVMAQPQPGRSETVQPDANVPEGMMEHPSHYRVHLEGNVVLAEQTSRLKFDLTLVFNTNRTWEEFRLRMIMRPDTWEILSRASEETVRLRTDGEDERSERVIKFADFQNPAVLAQDLEMPLAGSLGALGALGLVPGVRSDKQASITVPWEARNDWVNIGHTPVRAYRLEAQWLDHYRVMVLVNQVGEIVRVELPDGLVLVNEQMTAL